MEPQAISTCPYCGEPVAPPLEETQSGQEWIEDCSVCCQPIQFKLEEFDGEWVLSAERP